MSKRPTNAWFENLLVVTGRQPVETWPYRLAVTGAGLAVCVPVLDSTSFTTAVIAPFTASLTLASTAGALAPKVTSYTDLGCTVTWSAGLKADLVRGMAYATASYTALTPTVSTIAAFTSINGTAVSGTGTFTGTKFKVVLNSGQTWILYASSSITWTLSGQTLTAGATFTGTLRAAYLPTDAGAEAVLDAAAPVIPTGGSVQLSVSGSTSTKTLTWTTTGTGTLVTYCLPHHRDAASPTYAALTVDTLRGPVRGFTGTVLSQTRSIPTVGWDNARSIDPTRLAAVQSALAVDKTFVPTVADPYFGGKALAKAARLACIAHQLGDTAARDQLLGNLKTVLTNYLTGALSTKLRYDSVWGTVTSEAGLTDPNVDFGNGRANDHYFHYGYTVFAASVVARFDSAWATTNLARVNDLVRDICNPSTSDPYFVTWRHFDHFEGHSWAGGTFEFDAGRNQESTSEAVNAWYGVQQWGTATNQPSIITIGQALLTEEIATAQKYWQVRQADSLYPSTFRANGVVGIVWGGKVDYGTWFSALTECIFGIQMLPHTPALEPLLSTDWLTEIWTSKLLPIFSRTSPAPEHGWLGVLLAAYAQINPSDAWTRAQALTAYDDGTSKTQLLYHIATQVPITTQNLFTSQTPTTPNANDAAPLTVGTRFTPSVDGQVTGLRFYRATTAPTTATALLYDDGGNELARAAYGTLTTGWNTVSFPSPVAVTGDATYRAAYFTDGPYVTGSGLLPLTNGKLTTEYGCYQYGATPVFPSNLSTTSVYFADPVFKYAAVAPAAPAVPAAPVLSAANQSVQVTWSAPASNGSSITGYSVRNVNTGAVLTLGNVTSTSVTGLTNGTAYTFQVRATNAIGSSNYSLASAPATPSNLTAGYPDATNTGVPAGTTLTPYTGSTSINTDGTIIDGKTVNSQLTINASNVIIRNCQITCTSTYGVLVWGSNCTIQDCTISGNAGQVAITGFSDQGAGSVHVLRCNISGSPDQIRMGGNGSSVVDCYCHDVYGPHNGNPGAHNDTVGVLPGVLNTLIDHCTILNQEDQTSAVELGDTRGAQTSGTLQNCFIAGGGYTIYAMGPSTGIGWTVQNNKFSTLYFPRSGNFGPVNGWSTGTGNVWTNNTWADGASAGQAVLP